jgi:outer membrane protein, multidrug efflux system
MHKRPALTICLLTVSVLAACSRAPLVAPYQRPAFELPEAPTQAGVANIDWLSWWKAFQDPTLDVLLDEAAKQSQDLILASARIEEARALLSQNEANLYPTLDFTAGTSARRASQSSASVNPNVKANSTDLQLGLSASYEIDFWGKFARADDAARARLVSQMASQGTVLVSLYANVAQSYFAMRALDAQLVLAEQTLLTRQENLRLQKRRLEGGVISELDVRQAEAEAASVESTLRQTKQNLRNAESALALLLGRKPAEIAKPSIARGTDITTLFAAPAIPSNLPSDVLARRPDLMSAEQSLIAAHADIALARAAYFPRIALTAGLGLQSKHLFNLLEPSSILWNVLANLTQPIFRAGSIDAVVAAADARQKQALAQYTQAVQSAFRDIHDALNNVESARELTVIVGKRIEALRNTLRLADLRYKNGYSSYLEVLSAQRDLAQAESQLIDIQRAHLSAVVAVYKAVGGGWDAQSATPPPPVELKLPFLSKIRS